MLILQLERQSEEKELIKFWVKMKKKKKKMTKALAVESDVKGFAPSSLSSCKRTTLGKEGTGKGMKK